MLQSLKLFVVLFIMIHGALAAINYQIFKDHEHPDKCVIIHNEGQKILKFGGVIQHPTQCGRIECGRNGWALVYTCDSQTLLNGCAPAYYANKKVMYPYPYCCGMCNGRD